MDLTGTTGIASSRFQHYELRRRPDGTPWELGRGTMGVTYKAFDVNLRSEVALKVVNSALLHHPSARERFIREARSAACLRHRNIASVYHLGNDGERFFYAMEFIDGETLDTLVRRQGPLSPEAALRVLLQVARALAAAARQGVIHRDVKPGNIMVVHEDDDDHRVVKLIDFGLARAASSDEDPEHLTAHGFVGTPLYTSPEQLNEKPVDARSDIYSLGVTAWFLLTGRPPFSGTVASIFQQHTSKPPPWEMLPAAVPAPVRALLAHMLEKTPTRRPQSAVKLREEIEACRDALRLAAGNRTNGQARAAAGEVQLAECETSPGPGLAPAATSVPPRELGPGMILKGRYELLGIAGDGNSGRVFQARDRAQDNALRALKLLRADMTGETSKREILAEEVRLIQAAPHPNLLRLDAFERLNARAVDFLVQEWVQGFTVLDVLAARGGALPVREGLQILEQAAAAVDHAAARELERLDLALHQLHVHFRELPADGVRRLPATPLTGWPRWSLKVNPLGAIHDGLESSTWAGDVTMLPGATPALDRDTRLDDRGEKLAVSYMRGLAQAVYEMLGGAPGKMATDAERRGKYISLPTLNEGGNAVLQRALLDEPPAYENSRAMYEALAAVAGAGAAAPVAVPPARAPAPPAPAAAKPPPPAEPPPRRKAAQEASESIAYTLLPGDAARARTGDRDHRSLADLLEFDVPADDPNPFEARSGVWDRLALVSGAGRRYRGWLPMLLVAGLLLTALAAVAAVVGHYPTLVRAGRNRPAADQTNQPSSPPVATTPAAADLPPTLTIPSATVPAANSQVAAVPPELATSPATPAPSPRENPAKVHLESHPSGAEIRIGGKLLGTTPLDVVLPPGDYQLVARYRNWPEVRRSLHLEADQQTALDEIRLSPPAPTPPAEPSASPANRARRPAPGSPRREGNRPTPNPNPYGVIHFASPAPARTSPFLTQPTPARPTTPILTPFDPDGFFQDRPRRQRPPPRPFDDDRDGDD